MLDPVSCCTLPQVMTPADLKGLHDLSLKFGICQVPPLSSKWDVSVLSQWCKENILESVRGGTGTHVRTCVGVIVSDERASLPQKQVIVLMPNRIVLCGDKAELHSHQTNSKSKNDTCNKRGSMSLFCLGCALWRKMCALKSVCTDVFIGLC